MPTPGYYVPLPKLILVLGNEFYISRSFKQKLQAGSTRMQNITVPAQVGSWLPQGTSRGVWDARTRQSRGWALGPRPPEAPHGVPAGTERRQSGGTAPGSPESSRSRAGGARSQPGAGRQGAPHGPAPGGAPGGSGGCGFGVGIAAGSRVRPPGKGVGSWEGTGGTAGSVDNVFGDVKDDLGSFCAQVMQRLI